MQGSYCYLLFVGGLRKTKKHAVVITSPGKWSANHWNGAIVATFQHCLTPQHVLLSSKLVEEIKFPKRILAVILTGVFFSSLMKILGQ